MGHDQTSGLGMIRTLFREISSERVELKLTIERRHLGRFEIVRKDLFLERVHIVDHERVTCVCVCDVFVCVCVWTSDEIGFG